MALTLEQTAAAERRAAKAGQSGNTALQDRNLQLVANQGQAPETPVVADAGTPVDTAAEQETIASIGFSPTNDQETLDMAIATYGDNLPAVYEQLRTQLEGLKGTTNTADQDALSALGSSISGYGQTATDYAGDVATQAGQIPMNLNVLQEALKMTSNVGNQALGTSEIFAQAGVSGYGALSSALSARASEMDYKYDSFANLVTKIAGTQYAANSAAAAKAQTALDQYAILKDEYQYEQQRLDGIAQRAEDWERQLEGYAVQSDYAMKELAYKASLDQAAALSYTPSFDSSGNFVGTGGVYTDESGTTYLPTGTSVSEGEKVFLPEDTLGSEWAANCVKFAREYVPNIPFGLWNADDKAAAVQKYGSTDMSTVQVGDAIATYEGPYGHMAVVAAIDGDTLYLREANYTAGKVTEGRTLDKSSGKIMGYIRPSEEQAEAMQGIYNAQPNYMQNIFDEFEGMNPSGAETYKPSENYSDEDLFQAYKTAYAAANPSKSPGDVAAQAYTFLSDYVGTGDYQNGKQQIWNSAMNALDSVQRTKVLAAQDGVGTIDEINSLLKEYYAAGGKTDIFTGTIEEVTRKLGQSTDDRLVSISTLMQTAVDYRARQQSGAALTEYETAFYNSIFPAVNNLKNVNDALIDTQLGIFYREQKNRIGGVIGTDYYDKLFGPDTLSQERGWNDDDASNVESAFGSIFSLPN